MDTTPETTPSAEVNAQEASEVKAEPTVSDVLKDTSTVPKADTKPVVGLDKFLELKKENKQLRHDYEALQVRIESGASTGDVTDDIAALAETHNVDKGFLNSLVKSIKSSTQKEVEEKVAERLKPIEAEKQAERVEKAFNDHFNKVIDGMPEYANIVNRDVIKTLSLDPRNANKTFTQIIEETYQHVLPGKYTMESKRPAGGKDTGELDFERASTDEEYFEQVMANPKLKAEYNQKVISTIRL